MKAGFAGEEAPIVYPTIFGVPKYGKPLDGCYERVNFCCDTAIQYRAVVDLTYPIVRGEIEEWEQMEKILQYTFFNCLRVDPSEGNPILIIDNSLTVA